MLGEFQYKHIDKIPKHSARQIILYGGIICINKQKFPGWRNPVLGTVGTLRGLRSGAGGEEEIKSGECGKT